MTLRKLSLHLLAASLFLVPALGAIAQDEDVNVDMGINMGGMNMGLNMNVQVHEDDEDGDDENIDASVNVRGGDVRVRSTSSSSSSSYSVTTHSGTVRSAPTTAVVVTETVATCSAMNTGTFSEVMDALEEESFADGKLGVLGDAVENSCLSVAQVLRVLGTFDFGSDKLKALSQMAPQIANPRKKFKIYSAFDFDADKKKAKSVLASVH